MSWQLSSFEELRELGSGGSGRVVLARHLPTGTEVAIKYLAAWLADDPDLLDGFRSEARLMAGLVDPHLVTLYEYVETPSGAAIVMDLLEGVSLRRMLLSDGPLAPEAALTLLKGSLLGLAALHGRGVAHRDYKPDNVIVDDAGGTTLIDYGIAAPVGEIASASGTPRYMAPEQWLGEPSSAATDVYAATATFVECLTGRPVFSGETVPSLLHQHLNVPPPLDDVPEPVRPLAVAGLAKDPAERTTDATALMAQLETLAPVAYGQDWERRGRQHLAVRAALLALLFAHPRAPGAPQARAETDLGSSSPSDGAAEAGDANEAGELIGDVAGPPEQEPLLADAARDGVHVGAVRRHRSTLLLGFLLFAAAVLAAMHLGGVVSASTAAFDTGTATPGVLTPPLTPTPSPSPSAGAPASATPTPEPSVVVTPRPPVTVTPPSPEPPRVEPTDSPAPAGRPTEAPTSSPPVKKFAPQKSPPSPVIP